MQFTRVSPESVGIPSAAVLDLLDELYRQGIEMHSFMLLRHGKVCAEGSWAPYRPDVPHIMFSFSKSLTSTAIGFAVQEGILSLDDRLLDLFPQEAPENPSENLQKCQIRHLLMMGCGHESEIEWASGGDSSWIKTFMHHPFVYEPGTHFLYNTAGTNMLSAIITRKTGLTLTQFLKPRLFDPLGIGEVFCQPLPDGTEMGGAGMFLTLEDMARFVQFVANKGAWEEKQLLNSEWFDLATAKQIENAGAGWGGDPDWQAGYCFQFWRCAPDGVFRGDGAYGQFGVVMTKQHTALVIQSASLKLQGVLQSIWDKLLPQIAAAPLPDDPKAQHMLQKRLEKLELNPLLGMRNPGAEASLNGAVYVPNQPLPGVLDIVGGAGSFEPKGNCLNSLAFRFEENAAQLIASEDSGETVIDLGMEGHFASAMINGIPFGANASWRSRDVLEVQLRNIRMATGRRLLLHFAGDKLTITDESTLPEPVGLGDLPAPALVFTLSEGSVNTKTRMYWEVNQ
ncbi:class C beta-lactamase-related serine hydrolase [Acutalibacter sp. 1XD8-33]|uniref:serine hydrolase domain-containing protein n=1 Tax=Acutalibacter sp. 1XD8-33 TaxID=2320081 RepID=UPI000EA08C7A|nr:serine hydrolase [Acutalibacter sp. 1XD8-33]RKJ42006.1 class C beta-lactamase-related serine hydrolase [Acutalibacter sp. 1XD8-33]